MKSSRYTRVVRMAVAGLMLGLWLGTAALAVFPELHHFVHHDSQSATHECVATLLTKSQLLAGSIGSAGGILVFIFPGSRVFRGTPRYALADRRISPSRAPPFVVSSDAVAG